MKWYTYKAIGKLGSFVEGDREGLDKEDVKLELTDEGLKPIYVQRLNLYQKWRRYHRVSTEELLDFSFELYQLAESGMPLFDCLKLQAASDNPLQRVAQSLVTNIRGGHSLSESMERFPGIFDRIYISFIQVGEKTGHMSEAFQAIFEHLQWHLRLNSQISNAIRYPLFVFILLTFAMGILLVTLLPQFADFLHGMNRDLPTATVYLLSFSKFLYKFWLTTALLLFFMSATVSLLFIFHKGFRNTVRNFSTRLPYIGPILKDFSIARYLHCLGHMATYNVEFLNALQVAGESIELPSLSATFTKVVDDVMKGIPLSESFQTASIFPPSVIHMIAVGEKSGALPNCFIHLKSYYSRRIERKLDKLITYTEPVLTLFAGLFLFLIVYSVFWPIYETITLVDL